MIKPYPRDETLAVVKDEPEIPPSKGAEALRRLQGDVPLSCFGFHAEQDIRLQPAAAPVKWGIWKPSHFEWLELWPL
jgi:hypothetical protein